MAISRSPTFRPGLIPFSMYSSCSAAAFFKYNAAARFAGPAPTKTTSISICSRSIINKNYNRWNRAASVGVPVYQRARVYQRTRSVPVWEGRLVHLAFTNEEWKKGGLFQTASSSKQEFVN